MAVPEILNYLLFDSNGAPSDQQDNHPCGGMLLDSTTFLAVRSTGITEGGASWRPYFAIVKFAAGFGSIQSVSSWLPCMPGYGFPGVNTAYQYVGWCGFGADGKTPEMWFSYSDPMNTAVRHVGRVFFDRNAGTQGMFHSFQRLNVNHTLVYAPESPVTYVPATSSSPDAGKALICHYYRDVNGGEANVIITVVDPADIGGRYTPVEVRPGPVYIVGVHSTNSFIEPSLTVRGDNYDDWLVTAPPKFPYGAAWGCRSLTSGHTWPTYVAYPGDDGVINPNLFNNFRVMDLPASNNVVYRGIVPDGSGNAFAIVSKEAYHRDHITIMIWDNVLPDDPNAEPSFGKLLQERLLSRAGRAGHPVMDCSVQSPQAFYDKATRRWTAIHDAGTHVLWVTQPNNNVYLSNFVMDARFNIKETPGVWFPVPNLPNNVSVGPQSMLAGDAIDTLVANVVQSGQRNVMFGGFGGVMVYSVDGGKTWSWNKTLGDTITGIVYSAPGCAMVLYQQDDFVGFSLSNGFPSNVRSGNHKISCAVANGKNRYLCANVGDGSSNASAGSLFLITVDNNTGVPTITNFSNAFAGTPYFCAAGNDLCLYMGGALVNGSGYPLIVATRNGDNAWASIAAPFADNRGDISAIRAEPGDKLVIVAKDNPELGYSSINWSLLGGQLPVWAGEYKFDGMGGRPLIQARIYTITVMGSGNVRITTAMGETYENTLGNYTTWERTRVANRSDSFYAAVAGGDYGERDIIAGTGMRIMSPTVQ